MNGLFINVFEKNSQIYAIFDRKTAKFRGIFCGSWKKHKNNEQ